MIGRQKIYPSGCPIQRYPEADRRRGGPHGGGLEQDGKMED